MARKPYVKPFLKKHSFPLQAVTAAPSSSNIKVMA